MNLVLQSIIRISVIYTSLPDDTLSHNHYIADTLANIDISSKSDKIEEDREKLIAIKMNVLSKVLGTKDLAARINILEEDDGLENIPLEDIKGSICWNHVFSKEKERKMKHACEKNNLRDDFVIRLQVIIDELYYSMYRCYKYISVPNEVYSHEIINNLEFLKEICTDYFLDYKYEILIMVVNYLHIHFANALGRKDEGKTKMIIAEIKKYDTKLRSSILPICKSLLILNNRIYKSYYIIHFRGISTIPTDPNSFVIKNIIDCYRSVAETVRKQPIIRKVLFPKLLKLDEAINMEKVYENLGNLGKHLKNEYYTEAEYDYLVCLYLIEFAIESTSLIIRKSICSFVSVSTDCSDLFLTQFCDNYRLFIFIMSLLPGNFPKGYKETCPVGDAHLLLVFFKKMIKIGDFREHLLDENKEGDGSLGFSDLTVREQYGILKGVIECYVAGLDYKYYESSNNTRSNNYALEACRDISTIILQHFENIELAEFVDNNMYVKLCCSLRKLTNVVIKERDIRNNPTSFSDYPHFLEFYEEYHGMDLNINCIYNIGLLIGKSNNDNVLRLNNEDVTNIEIIQFYNLSNIFMKHLRSIEYETLSYDEDLNDTLDHIIMSLVEIKNEKFMNMTIKCNILPSRDKCIFHPEKNKSLLQFQLYVIREFFRSNLHCYTDLIKSTEDEIYKNIPLKKLYEAKYISDADVARLYDGLCDFILIKEPNTIKSLQRGVLSRRNKKNIAKVLTDIMFNAFKLIRNSNENVIDGLKAAQSLFRSFNDSYSVHIERKVVTEFNLTDHSLKREDMIYVVKVLGIYVLFEETKCVYLTIARSKSDVKNAISDYQNSTYNKECVYNMISSWFDVLDSNIQKSIFKPNESILRNIGTQLLIILEAIDSSNNDVIVLVKAVLEFISKISNIENEYTSEDIRLVIENMIGAFNSMSLYFTHISVLNYASNWCKSISDMARLVLQVIKKDHKEISADFINHICLVLSELSDNIQPYGILENVVMYKYICLRDKFLVLIEDVDIFTKWDTLSLMICKKNNVFKQSECENIPKLFMIIRRIITNDSESGNDYTKFMSLSSSIFKRLLIEIDKNPKNCPQLYNQLFDVTCSLVQQNSSLFRKIGYNNITISNVDKDCYICREEIKNIPVQTLNCVCKSAVADFNCLLKFYLHAYNHEKTSEFKMPSCCICDK